MKKYIVLFGIGMLIVLLGVFFKVQHFALPSDVFLLTGLVMEFVSIAFLIKGESSKKIRNAS